MQTRIIQRTQWGARHDDGFHDRRLPVDECWLHHSVTIAPDLVTPWTDDYAAVRTLEDIGESRFGRGISYTYAITPAGLVFQGHSAHRSGAHTLNRNDIAVAIVWVGRYDTREPTEAQIRATAWLLVQCKRDGVLRRARIDGGHGQAPGQSTDCPGGYGRAAIARINQLAAQYERGEIDLSIKEDDVTAAEVWTTPVPSHSTPSYAPPARVWLTTNAAKLERLQASVDNIAGALTERHSELLAAVREGQDETTPTDYERLGKSIAANLPAPSGGMTPQDLERELLELFGRIYNLGGVERSPGSEV
ncbi:hypothetical protein BBK82_04935 [Lentzea guizhouensis]|uniref:Peptidoglycan recognition protein family domain-containing protein n=1 Tax=Lentzea guizhouensis TaxID=1586287 RepID=A0A1B2HCS5_9PSEU|nr:peptidoglycan recognition family protein [Lentzea guizhouensis]ANZ35521.1 hypothetical protein BBK82_04935 [Lentzea guizhouensis]